MRLIDADWLEELLLAHEQNARAMVASGRKTSFTYADGIRTGYADVGLCPTIEAEPVVRCKDCEYRYEKAFRSVDGDVVEYNYCSQWNRESNINGYCYKGERKNEVEE